MDIGPLIGLAGDFTTLCGGLVLARDAVNRERYFTAIEKILEARETTMKGLELEVEGVPVNEPADVERGFSRHESHMAVLGSYILVAGFALLLVARVFEIYKR